MHKLFHLLLSQTHSHLSVLEQKNLEIKNYIHICTQHYMLCTSTVCMYVLYGLLMLNHITHDIIALMNSLWILHRTQLEKTITLALGVQHQCQIMSPIQLECQHESSAHMLSAKYTYFIAKYENDSNLLYFSSRKYIHIWIFCFNT